jgi:serine/threonine-protein kinase RsbW
VRATLAAPGTEIRRLVHSGGLPRLPIARTPMFAQVVVKLTGPMDHLRLVWQTGETLLESVAFDEDAEGTRYNILLALQEMVTNVLRHAYRMDEQRPVELVFELTGDTFAVELRDQGPAFDPVRHEVPERQDESMLTEAGGHGIRIVRMVMDDVSYRRQDGWNCLRMTKCVRVIAAI